MTKNRWILITLFFAYCVYAGVTFKPGPISDDRTHPRMVLWHTLSYLDYEHGKIPDSLKRYDGVHIKVPGYMQPLDDSGTTSSEFLLIPVEGNCSHVPPPPPNQVVLVKMTTSGAPYTWKPIWVTGLFRIEPPHSSGETYTLHMDGESVEEFKGDTGLIEDF